MAAASEMAAARSPSRANGTDGLDLLVAVTKSPVVIQFLQPLGLDPEAIARQAHLARMPNDEPGLTADAKRVVEMVGHRAIERRRDPTSVDLFVALALTTGPARDVLLALGLDPAQLASLDG